MTLNEIGLKHGTDKSSIFHHYLGLYELLFARFLDAPKILEIGVLYGNSIRAWAEYYPKGTFVGIDKNALSFSIDKVAMIAADAYHLSTIEQLKGQMFDVIIDDGSHVLEDQQWFLQNYWTLLQPHGMLIVEDVVRPEYLDDLIKLIPEGFQYTAVEMAKGEQRPNPDVNLWTNSRLFIIWRK